MAAASESTCKVALCQMTVVEVSAGLGSGQQPSGQGCQHYESVGVRACAGSYVPALSLCPWSNAIPISQDKATNIAHARDMVKRAVDSGAALVVLPEVFNG